MSCSTLNTTINTINQPAIRSHNKLCIYLLIVIVVLNALNDRLASGDSSIIMYQMMIVVLYCIKRSSC